MITVSAIENKAPMQFKTNLQEKVYRTLAQLQIPYERVDTDEVITMEDCIAVNERLDMKMVKNIWCLNILAFQNS